MVLYIRSRGKAGAGQGYSQFTNMLTLWFAVGWQSGISLASGTNGSNRQDSDASSYSTGQGGLPTPESLAEVLQSTRRLVVEQAAECLLVCSWALNYFI